VPSGKATINTLCSNSLKNGLESLSLDSGATGKFAITEYYPTVTHANAVFQSLYIKSFNVLLAELQKIVNNMLTRKELHFIQCTFPDLSSIPVFNGAADSNISKIIFDRCDTDTTTGSLTDPQKKFLTDAVTNAANFTIVEFV